MYAIKIIMCYGHIKGGIMTDTQQQEHVITEKEWLHIDSLYQALIWAGKEEFKTDREQWQTVRSRPSATAKVLEELDKLIKECGIKIEDESEGNYYTRSDGWEDLTKRIKELQAQECG
jgi:hypothetical protein